MNLPKNDFVGFVDEVGALSEKEIARIAIGIAAFRPFIGSDDIQQKIFQNHINWDRVLLYKREGKLVGFISFFYKGRGPFSPDLKIFTHTFGYPLGYFRFILYKILEKRCAMPECYAFKLWVIKPMRQCGIGSRLMASLIIWAKEQYIKTIEAEIFTKNRPSIGLLEKQGFNIIKTMRLPFLKNF